MTAFIIKYLYIVIAGTFVAGGLTADIIRLAANAAARSIRHSLRSKRKAEEAAQTKADRWADMQRQIG